MMWRGYPRERAVARAIEVAQQHSPADRAVVRTCELSGIDWIVRMWLFQGSFDNEPREARVRIGGSCGRPLEFALGY